MLLMRLKKEKTRIIILIIGVISLVFSFSLIYKKVYETYINKKVEEKSMELFYENQNNNEEIKEENTEEKEEERKSNVVNYIAILEISKLNLKKGLVDLNNRLNNINYNIEILKGSDMPDIINGHFILASHSGNSNVSYFRNLNKLEISDEIKVYYNKKEYFYKVEEIYDIKKIGKAMLRRKQNKSNISLITCIPKTDKQLVVLGTLYKIK